MNYKQTFERMLADLERNATELREGMIASLERTALDLRATMLNSSACHQTLNAFLSIQRFM